MFSRLTVFHRLSPRHTRTLISSSTWWAQACFFHSVQVSHFECPHVEHLTSFNSLIPPHYISSAKPPHSTSPLTLLQKVYFSSASCNSRSRTRLDKGETCLFPLSPDQPGALVLIYLNARLFRCTRQVLFIYRSCI
jgi:hypothetical protein